MSIDLIWPIAYAGFRFFGQMSVQSRIVRQRKSRYGSSIDMTSFFNQYHSVMPYLINDTPPPERERLQSPDLAGQRIRVPQFLRDAILDRMMGHFGKRVR